MNNSGQQEEYKTTYFITDKETNIFHRDGSHFKIRVWNSDSGLQIKVEAVKYINRFLEKSCKYKENFKRKEWCN